MAAMDDKPMAPFKKKAPVAWQATVEALRKLKARHAAAQDYWAGLGMLGLFGWSVALPMLFGIVVGLWLDFDHPGGHVWTLSLMAAGIAIGCLQAWKWISKENKEIEKGKAGRPH
jgi:ATP synthase protein I